VIAARRNRSIGRHAPHEQFTPRDLLAHLQHAGRAGFTATMCSDHSHPWSEAQGQSCHAWTWLGAAMATTSLPFGVVDAPVGRCHPTVIAQAAATLAQMFDGRFWIAVGSGEALNECITGDCRPPKDPRSRRLLEAVEVMRALRAGEELRTPAQYEAAAQCVTPDDMRDMVRVSCDLQRQLAWLQEGFAMGFDELRLHNVHPEQTGLIDAFGEHVLPALRG
jgi:alkanesulfonate monooxygenase SsuD/methylene tetrahydromethanopterin reductase-like flavin-dependent oxidoreductase (luciferase family)